MGIPLFDIFGAGAPIPAVRAGGLTGLVQAATDAAKAAADATLAFLSFGLPTFRQLPKLLDSVMRLLMRTMRKIWLNGKLFNASFKAWLFYGNVNYDYEGELQKAEPHGANPVPSFTDREPQDAQDRRKQVYGMLTGKPLDGYVYWDLNDLAQL